MPLMAFDQPWDGGHNTTTPYYYDPENPYVPEENPNCPQPQSPRGSPVYVARGVLFLHYEDIKVSGVGPELELTRHYMNQDRYDGPFGYGWHFNYSIQLYEVTDLDDEYVIIRRGTGRRWEFIKNQDGTYTSKTRGVIHSLTKNPDGSFIFSYVCSDCIGLLGDVLHFDSEGRLTAVEDNSGNRLEFDYDIEGHLTTATDAVGREIHFFYNYENKITRVLDPGGNLFIYTYDGEGNLSSVTDPVGNQTVYIYDEEHDLVNVIDANNDTALEVSYDNRDRVSSCTRYGYTETYDYNPGSSYTVKNTPRGNYTYYYDDAGNVTRTVYPDGTEREDEINLNVRPTRRTAPDGSAWEYEYDGWGNVTRITQAAGTELSRNTHYTYDFATKNLTGYYRNSVRNPSGYYSVSFEYDEIGNITKLTKSGYIKPSQPFTYETTYAFDNMGLLTRINGPRTEATDVITYSYDSMGQLTSFTLPEEGAWSYNEYNAFGKPGLIIDPNGNTSGIEYDAINRLTKITANGETFLEYEYDGIGNVTKISNTLGAGLSLNYTQGEMIAEVIKPDGSRLLNHYEGWGLIAKKETYTSEDVLESFIDYEYDSMKRMTKVIYPGSATTEIEYDAAGNLTKVIDRLGNEKAFEYDALNRLTARRVIVPDGDDLVTTYEYDEWDNLTAFTDPEAHVVSLTPDDMGRVAEETTPAGGHLVYEYNATGMMTKIFDANGDVIQKGYDAQNRVTSIDYPDPAENVTYSYDETSVTNGKGMLTGMTDRSGTTIYNYDQRSRVTNVQRTIDGNDYITLYQYDPNDNLTKATYPSGIEILYDYDSSDMVSRIRASVNEDIHTIADSITYNSFSAVASMSLGTGMNRTVSYDSKRNITGLSAGGFQDITIAYDAMDNITSITDNLNSAENQTFDYDILSQLTSASGAYGAVTYAYDDAGNRTLISPGSDTVNYNYTDNRLTSLSGDITENFAYDGNGNITATSSKTFSYNGTNQLTRIMEGEELKGSYTVDGRRRRVIKETTAEKVIYIHSYVNTLLEESDENGTPLQSYVYLYNQPVAKIVGDQVYYMINDHRGVPTKLTDSSENVVWEGEFRPFGSVNIQMETISNELRYPGQLHDSESGLHYNHYRYYDPELGRYYSAEMYKPWLLQNGNSGPAQNGMAPTPDYLFVTAYRAPYTYAGNDPLMYVDRDGQLAIITTLAIAAAIGAVFGGASQAVQGGSASDIATGALIGAGAGALGAGAGAAVAAGGAAIGVIGGAGSISGALVGGAAGGAVGSAAEDIGNQLWISDIPYRCLDWGHVGVSAAFGAGTGAASGFVGDFVTYGLRDGFNTQLGAELTGSVMGGTYGGHIGFAIGMMRSSPQRSCH